MAAHRQVYDSSHLLVNCQEPNQLRNPMLSIRVWATFTFLKVVHGTEIIDMNYFLFWGVVVQYIDEESSKSAEGRKNVNMLNKNAF